MKYLISILFLLPLLMGVGRLFGLFSSWMNGKVWMSFMGFGALLFVLCMALWDAQRKQ